LYHNSAKEYQIKYSEVFDNLMDNNFNSNLSVQFGQQDVLDGSLQPLESGSKQRVSLALPKASQNVTYYIALQAINNKNLTSNTSNVVSVQIAIVQQPETQPPSTQTVTTTTTSSTTTTTSSTTHHRTRPTATPTMSTTWSPDTTTTAGIHFKLLIRS
jgi:cell division septation protein DedD